jgi:hypothetical protein
MKKIDLGRTINTLANVGVIAGIVFLGYEVHQNNEQLTAQSRFNYYQTRTSFDREFATDEQLVAVWLRAGADLESLTPIELARVSAWARAIFGAWEYELSEFEQGLLSADQLNVPGKRAFYEVQRSVLDVIWSTYRATAPENFVRYMEEQVMLSDQ